MAVETAIGRTGGRGNGGWWAWMVAWMVAWISAAVSSWSSARPISAMSSGDLGLSLYLRYGIFCLQYGGG